MGLRLLSESMRVRVSPGVLCNMYSAVESLRRYPKTRLEVAGLPAKDELAEVTHAWLCRISKVAA